jgi:hypothetical protein
MTIYLVKGYLDQAATSLADARALLAALANPATAANSATLARIGDTLETLVQSDSGEPITLSSIDDTAGTISSWVTDASTTLALGLGDADSGNAYTYASTTGFTISGSTRVATLALDTSNLRDALGNPSFSNSSPYRFTNRTRFVLQLRKTTGGVTETVGLLDVEVRPGVLSSTPGDLGATTYVTTPVARAGYVINLSGVTSLTGGGATTLDGQEAGTATFPVGCIVITSDGGATPIFRTWRLLAGTTSATDLSALKIRPTNYNATTNAVYWQG